MLCLTVIIIFWPGYAGTKQWFVLNCGGEVSRFNKLMIHIFLPQISRPWLFSLRCPILYIFNVYEIFLNTILCWQLKERNWICDFEIHLNGTQPELAHLSAQYTLVKKFSWGKRPTWLGGPTTRSSGFRGSLWPCDIVISCSHPGTGTRLSRT